MRGKIFKELAITDKKSKLSSILKRVSKDRLTMDEINLIVNNIDMDRQYLIQCTNDKHAYSKAITLNTDIKFDSIKGSSGFRTILHDVLLLEKEDVVIINPHEGPTIINEFKTGLFIVDSGKFINGISKEIKMYHNSEVTSGEKVVSESKF